MVLGNDFQAAVVAPVNPVEAHGQGVALPSVGRRAGEGPRCAHQLLAALDDVDGTLVAGGDAPLAPGSNGMLRAAQVSHREDEVTACPINPDVMQSQQIVIQPVVDAQQLVFQRVGAIALGHVNGQCWQCGLQDFFLVKHRLYQLVVERVQLVAIVRGTAVDHDHHVQFGHHIDELPAIARRKVALGARVLDGLGLIAITQVVVVNIVAREPRAYLVPHALQETFDSFSPREVGTLFCLLGADQALGHVVNPLGTDELLAVPLALLQHELTQLGLALGMQAQAPGTDFDAVGRQFPVALSDVQRRENAFPHIFQQRFAREPCDDHCQHMGAHRVVVEHLAHALEVAGKPSAQPVLIALKDAQVLLASCCHHEHVTHGEAVQRGRQRGGHLVEQIFGDFVIDREQPVIDCKPYCKACHRLAGTVERVQVGRLIGRCMPLTDDLAVAQHHQVMDVHIGQCRQFVAETP